MVRDLRRKGDWIVQHIRRQEKILGPANSGANNPGRSGNPGPGWFNGYYDNQGEKVEGKKEGGVRMTLTGQVFPVMSGVAEEKEVKEVVQAVRRYLKDKKLGGYRLNTDFKVPHYLELGRAFGFAYGTKENGSFFSHMAVMYAYALYKRNFARDGHDVLQSIFRMAADTEKSRIYPGIPEYFDSLGRGRYHYLTGSASWLVLTMLTQVFGVRGEGGDLVLAPQLLKEQFDRDGKASVMCSFAGKRLSVTYLNELHLDFGAYAVKQVSAGGKPVVHAVLSPVKVKISRKLIEQYGQPELELVVRLG
ncbi:MAG: hypothetical protein HZA29_04500 [Candidatus Omnitrophica bacterium]|nr:hypothetical protein [Candidatus Omnitrophota bacterium]